MRTYQSSTRGMGLTKCKLHGELQYWTEELHGRGPCCFKRPNKVSWGFAMQFVVLFTTFKNHQRFLRLVGASTWHYFPNNHESDNYDSFDIPVRIIFISLFPALWGVTGHIHVQALSDPAGSRSSAQDAHICLSLELGAELEIQRATRLNLCLAGAPSTRSASKGGYANLEKRPYRGQLIKERERLPVVWGELLCLPKPQWSVSTGNISLLRLLWAPQDFSRHEQLLPLLHFPNRFRAKRETHYTELS